MQTSNGSGDTIARRLARFATGLRYEDLPQPIIARAKALVLDQLGCELIGSTMPWMAPALKLVRLSQGATPESTLVNFGSRVAAADAAFANASFGHACEMDDAAFGSSGHIGTATVPVALAVGERERCNGREFLAALVAGYDVMYRLMSAVTPHNIERGFQSQGIGGPFGAAATAGKLLGLDAEQMTHALAIAGSHSAGPAEYDQSGGEVKRIHAGIAARGGIHSALLAKFGLTGPATIIEGKRGFCNLFAAQSDPARITVGLGEDLKIANASFKMYPAVGGVHTVIAALQHLAKEHDIAPDDVAAVKVGLAKKRLLHGAAIRRPHDVASAQFSIAFSAALAVCKRANELGHYTDPALWGDRQILEMVDRVEIFADGAATGTKISRAAVRIELKSGRSVGRIEDYPKGTPVNPVTPEEHQAKVRSLCGTVLSPKRIDALMEAVNELEDLPDIGHLALLLVGEEKGSLKRRLG